MYIILAKITIQMTFNVFGSTRVITFRDSISHCLDPTTRHCILSCD